MNQLNRRALLATGTTLAAGGLFGSLPAAADEHGEDDTGEGNGALEGPTGVAWRYDGPHNISATVAADGRVYTLADGGVIALDAEDGSPVWETGDIGAERTLVVAEGSVFVAGDPVQAIDAETGEVRWEGEIASQEMAVGHGMVYTSSEYDVYALDGEDGSVQWSRESATVETDDGERTAEELILGDVAEDAVYAADSNEHLIVGFDPATGETTVTIAQDQPANLLTAGSGHVAGYPAHDTAFLITVETEERTEIPQSVTHTIVGDTYFSTTRNGSLTAFDLSDTAEHAWEVGTDLGTEHELPAVVGGTAVTTHVPRPADQPDEEDNEDRVVALDLTSGEEQWRYVFEEPGGIELGDADGDTVYAGRNGELLALRSEDDGETEDDEQEDEPAEDEEEQSQEEPDDDEESADDGSEDGGSETEEPAEDETGDEGSDTPEDGQNEDGTLELSVSAPDSIARGETASVDVRVWNHGEDAAEVTISLKAGDVAESTTVEIAPGDCYASFHAVPCGDLSLGDNEWTITAGEQEESGTLTLTDN